LEKRAFPEYWEMTPRETRRANLYLLPLVFHEVQIAAGVLVFEFESQGFLDFAELEGNCCVLLVTIGMVMGEDSLGLLITLLGDEPTWRFWDPVDECELDQGRQALKKGKGSP